MGVLASSYFRDSERLQKCAVDPKYHVVIGDRGDHVLRIQLFIADWVSLLIENWIDSEETQLAMSLFRFMETGVYNAGFAELVQFYKEMNNVIDRTRQSRPDKIVGILTIRTMDFEGRGFDLRRPQQPTEAFINASPPTMRIAATLGSRHILGRLKHG